ncbi:hypothetical protein N7470_001461 [Penicillium chermesinum]|nr:hypothetical protein N7470_001461 [Penicillium chermesinum]
MSPPLHPQLEALNLSLRDPEAFWADPAARIHWHRKPYKALTRRRKTLPSGVEHEHWSWFPGGELSTTYNCVDRHVLAGRGSDVAIVWESPVTNTTEKYTYQQLLDEVEVLAGVLQEEGVRKGDVVIIYMPMIPAALIAALAITRLGAIHSAVFGGFAATSLAQRIEAARPKAIMTASCGIEGTKGAIAYRPLVEGAIAASTFKPLKTIIWQRDQLRWHHPDRLSGQRPWQRLVKSARARGIRAAAVPVASAHPLYIIYTSGTTGLPKGVVREAGGHAVGLELSIRSLFGIKGPGDVMFCASDIGWVVGHSYILYAPLLVGATTVLYEGKPVGTPDAGAFWRVVEKNAVNVLFTAPTALRAIRKEDGGNVLFREVARRGGLKSLRALFLAGNAFLALGGEGVAPLAIRPGSAGLPMPGFDVRIVDDEGVEVPRGTMGNIVMAAPLAPTAFTTLFEDEERFYRGYLKRFNGRWLDTGDAGLIDEDGYVHIMSRSDDVINVAAHRFSTGQIEQTILSHPSISEASVVGIPDSLKGHLPFAFIQLKADADNNAEGALPATAPPELTKEVNTLVREQIGAIATLGGIIQGRGMIPKTRSGKTLRRVLRELLENGTQGNFEKPVNVPPTVEDAAVVEVARGRVKEYFEAKAKTKAKL